MRQNHFKKLLNSQESKTRKTVHKPYAHVDWENAQNAGLFTNADVDELEASYQKLRKDFKRGERRSSRKSQPTIRTATREQLIAALHKALV